MTSLWPVDKHLPNLSLNSCQDHPSTSSRWLFGRVDDVSSSRVSSLSRERANPSSLSFFSESFLFLNRRWRRLYVLEQMIGEQRLLFFFWKEDWWEWSCQGLLWLLAGEITPCMLQSHSLYHLFQVTNPSLAPRWQFFRRSNLVSSIHSQIY